MMRQYLAIKREVPEGAIVMFRLGDFYEMFGEDAAIAAPILGATLTKRNGQPMCGVPHHALNTYLAKLIRAGKTAAVCEQVEDPKTAKGLVRREVTRIITPGTVTEDGLLDETANNYIAAVAGNSLAMLDLSTGEFMVEGFGDRGELVESLRRCRPAEIIAGEGEEGLAEFSFTPVGDWTFAVDAATECLTRHFKVLALDGFGLEGKGELVSAAGALLYYVGITLRHSVAHVRRVFIRSRGESLALDGGTIRHLQLLPGGEVSREASLFGVLDATKTPMGARCLRNSLGLRSETSTRVSLRLSQLRCAGGPTQRLLRAGSSCQEQLDCGPAICPATCPFSVFPPSLPEGRGQRRLLALLLLFSAFSQEAGVTRGS